ncbi:MAG TPA: hypothetical protein VM681_05500 [Candidatus Thermoplasmatota archaeon]|nr:hypothetical protein [Candidatus Thermoplasmatota archaeon]
MRIDIGNGKILGTKRVSPNGQVSGFSEYAGREVLVILPDETPRVEMDPSDVLREIEYATREQMKLAFERYKQMKERFETPENATAQFLRSNTPKSFHNLLDKVERWVAEQVEPPRRGRKATAKEA